MPLHATIEVIQQPSDDFELSCFLSLKGAYEQSSGKALAASKTYAQLESILPQKGHAFVWAKTKLAFERGRFKEATEHGLALDLSQRQDKEIAFITAQSHLFLNQMPAALELLHQLSAHYPHDERFDYFIALAYMKTEQNTKALTRINKVLSEQARTGKHYLFLYLKAKIAFASGDLESARKEAEASLCENPACVKPLQLLGAIAEKKRDDPEALAFYKRYLALNPTDIEVANTAAALAVKIGNFELAEKIITAHPSNTAKYFHNKALLQASCKQFALAKETIEKASALDPTNSKIQELKEVIAKVISTAK